MCVTEQLRERSARQRTQTLTKMRRPSGPTAFTTPPFFDRACKSPHRWSLAIPTSRIGPTILGIGVRLTGDQDRALTGYFQTIIRPIVNVEDILDGGCQFFSPITAGRTFADGIVQTQLCHVRWQFCDMDRCKPHGFFNESSGSRQLRRCLQRKQGAM